MNSKQAPAIEEAIPGLRAALAVEREAIEARNSVQVRLEAANYAHATARAYRTALLQRSAGGEPVDHRELVAADAAITEAKAAVDTFPAAVVLADRAVARAQGGVATVLRSALYRRRDIAQKNLEAAAERARRAAAERNAAAEAFQKASGAADYGDGDFLREIFATELNAAVS